MKQLAVLFQGQDIQQENANLKILVVRIVNEGEVNILENYFDSRLPWGLDIQGGRVIEVRITGSNSRYLVDNLHPTITDENRITLDKVIFDRGKYVNLELLVLHNKNAEPRVAVFGKIPGMDDVPVTSSFKEREQQGLAKSVFKGPIAVQIARTIAYSLIGLTAAIAIGFSIGGIASAVSRLKKRARRRLSRYLSQADSPEKEKKRQVLIDIYIENGLEGLVAARAFLEREKNGKNKMRKSSDSHPPGTVIRSESGPLLLADGPVPVLLADGSIVVSSRIGRNLLREDFVRSSGDSIEIDAEGWGILQSLINQVSELEGKPVEASGPNLVTKNSENIADGNKKIQREDSESRSTDHH